MNIREKVHPLISYAVLGGFLLLSIVLLLSAVKADTTGKKLAARTYSPAKIYSGATLVTSKGSIDIQFLSDKTPKTVENFIILAEKKFFDGTKFHRVIKNFIIQGGDPESLSDDTSNYGRGGPGYTFDDEIVGEKMKRGVVAMANFGPNTNGSQFFILLAKEAPWLDRKHTVFAYVTGGLDIADEIAASVAKDDVPTIPIELREVILR